MSTLDRVIEASVPDLTQVLVESQVGPNVAVARVQLGEFVAVGDTKRANGDPFDADVARALAVGRALQALGQGLEESALETSDILCEHLELEVAE